MRPLLLFLLALIVSASDASAVNKNRSYYTFFNYAGAAVAGSNFGYSDTVGGKLVCTPKETLAIFTADTNYFANDNETLKGAVAKGIEEMLDMCDVPLNEIVIGGHTSKPATRENWVYHGRATRENNWALVTESAPQYVERPKPVEKPVDEAEQKRFQARWNQLMEDRKNLNPEHAQMIVSAAVNEFMRVTGAEQSEPTAADTVRVHAWGMPGYRLADVRYEVSTATCNQAKGGSYNCKYTLSESTMYDNFDGNPIAAFAMLTVKSHRPEWRYHERSDTFYPAGNGQWRSKGLHKTFASDPFFRPDNNQRQAVQQPEEGDSWSEGMKSWNDSIEMHTGKSMWEH